MTPAGAAVGGGLEFLDGAGVAGEVVSRGDLVEEMRLAGSGR